MGDGDCRTCTISAAIGFALDICHQENIVVDSLQRIYDEGYANETDVLTALEEFNSSVPEARRLEAKSVKCFAFSSCTDCSNEF